MLMAENSVPPSSHPKRLGAYYTPSRVVRSLVSWASDGIGDGGILDPSCGDGRFLEGIRNAVGVDVDPEAITLAASCTQADLVTADFFAWARDTDRRFAAVVGNPPFIRYQTFSGDARRRALDYCKAQGVTLSGLSSSWAPFVVGATSLLHRGGRLAFVVPAEIGHAVYAKPVVRHLLASFERVEFVAVREKLFPELSEDCWLLRASGFGGRSDTAYFAKLESFEPEDDWAFESIPVAEIERWRFRLRPLIANPAVRDAYLKLALSPGTVRLGGVAKVGIGYVTGANGFFHLRPSTAERLGIPDHLLRVSVRSNRDLIVDDISEDLVASWRHKDRRMLLLDLKGVRDLPHSVLSYLDSPAGNAARQAYKCRNRKPWFAVPDVRVPDAFLSIMAGRAPRLVGNSAGAACTNSVHAVSFTNGAHVRQYVDRWKGQLTKLSCEIEGHALGGGVLKIEPSEARQILLALNVDLSEYETELLVQGAREFRRWRNADVA